ncbi:TPA: tyrosine-type recombinase/integrase [Vibrio vulnificus]|nr:tyrosine-type recombinase/integrase [Vibrio vulnificus]
MTPSEKERFDALYQQHLTQLKLQGKRAKTISAYSLAVRRITEYFDRCPDTLTIEDLRRYFSQLIGQVSWSTIKLDRCGLQFFYKHTLNKQWEWIGIIKPPKVKRLPNIISPEQVAQIINTTRETRYQVLFLTLYTMGLRINEALNLTISDIDSHNMQVHIRYGKGGKDRLVPLPHRTLHALRRYWCTHRHPKLLFPSKGKCCDVAFNDQGAQKALKQVVHECGIHKRITPHSLRHCFATHLLEQGLDLRSLQILLGHASLNTTARYTQLTQLKLHDANQALNQLADRLHLDWELTV